MIPKVKKWQEDELLYSWLHRLAEANGLSMAVFMEGYLGIADGNYTMGQLTLDVRKEYVSFAKNIRTTKTLSELYWESSIYGFESMWMTKEQQARYVNNVFRKRDAFNSPVNTLIQKAHLCKECYEEDMKRKMPYLRCKHHISGVITCYKHKTRLLEYVGRKGHECEYQLSDYKEIESDKNISSLNAYTEYATALFDAYINTDIRTIRNVLFEEIRANGYSAENGYERLRHDLNEWKYKDLLPENIKQFLLVKLIGTSNVKATEIIPFLMYFLPDIRTLQQRVETDDGILEERTCKVCGLEYCTTSYAEKVGFECPDCEAKLPIQRRFKRYVARLDSNYEFKEEFVSLDKKLSVYHKVCNQDITIKPRGFLYEGTRCKCEAVINEWDAKEKIEKHKGFRLIEFNGSNNPVTIYSESCGHTFPCNYFKFLDFPGCRVCKPKHMTAEIFAERIYKLVGDEYRIIEGFVDQHTKVVLEHKICGERQPFKPSHFLDGQRCKHCTKLEAGWNKQYELLCEYQKEFGHVNVLKRDEYGGIALGVWCQRMRSEYRNGKLSKYQINKLEVIGFDWDPLETEWMRRYKQYKRYVEATGSLEITRKTDFEGEHLGAWVETQRKWYAKGKMSEKRIALLKQIGVEFTG